MKTFATAACLALMTLSGPAAFAAEAKVMGAASAAAAAKPADKAASAVAADKKASAPVVKKEKKGGC